MALQAEVTHLLDAVVGAVSTVLCEELLGVYVRGSLATDDFVPETSDVDTLMVTERPVTEAEFALLAAMHADLARLPSAYANRLEAAYIGREALRRFQPGLSHPTLGQGETLLMTEHREHWVLERWVVREHGITLVGPQPRTLIDPVSRDQIRAAVRSRLQQWAGWVTEQDAPGWVAHPGLQAYIVETMCRALHALSCGEPTSKAAAVGWALESLPAEWRPLVAQAQRWKREGGPPAAVNPEVKGFVWWAAAGAGE
ncbi:MAG: aminoglycoside adenylyltransferase domain-containing protein [Tepidiformaceae bacterium]